MLYNRCTGIYKFENNTYPRRIRRRSNLGHHFSGKKVRLMGREIGNYEGKAVPLQAWSGPEGSRKLRFPDLMTTAQDGGKVVSLTHRPSLSPGNTPEVKVPRFNDNGTGWW